MYSFIYVNSVCVDSLYSAGLAGAFIDKQVETHGVSHLYKLCLTNLV